MAERLTTNQEVPGSTPGWIDPFTFACQFPSETGCDVYFFCFVMLRVGTQMGEDGG